MGRKFSSFIISAFVVFVLGLIAYRAWVVHEAVMNENQNFSPMFVLTSPSTETQGIHTVFVAVDSTKPTCTRDPFRWPDADKKDIPPVPDNPTLKLLWFSYQVAFVQIEVSYIKSPRLSVGQSFNGWLVTDITPSSATLKKINRVVTLTVRS